jgi:hypothetical protein
MIRLGLAWLLMVAALLGVSPILGKDARTVAGTACPAFPPDSWFHADVSELPVHSRSNAWLSHMSPTRNLHPDFGKSYGAQPAPYGIPITVVGRDHAKVDVHFDYASQSDRVRFPLGLDIEVEGG